MKAAVMRAVGEPLTVVDVSVDAPRASEVRVRLAAAGLCHSDLRFLEGAYPHPLPTILGHESAGIVEAVGKDVTYVRPGDHVITHISVSCGLCSHCVGGRIHLCDSRDTTGRPDASKARLSIGDERVHQFLSLSSFAEEVLVHESALVRIPGSVPLDAAALLGCGVATGLGAVFNSAGVRPDESVAILGCGGVGLAAVQGARIAGARQVIAIDTVEAKLGVAARLGADQTVDATSVDPLSAVLDLTSGAGVDHAIEAIGTTATAEKAFAMIRRGGTATIVGLIPGGEKLRIPADLLFHERRIQGSVLGSNRPRIDVPRYIQMYEEGALDLDVLVTRRLTLTDINDAFADMRAGRAIRGLVVFD